MAQSILIFFLAFGFGGLTWAEDGPGGNSGYVDATTEKKTTEARSPDCEETNTCKEKTVGGGNVRTSVFDDVTPGPEAQRYMPDDGAKSGSGGATK